MSREIAGVMESSGNLMKMVMVVSVFEGEERVRARPKGAKTIVPTRMCAQLLLQES